MPMPAAAAAAPCADGAAPAAHGAQALVLLDTNLVVALWLSDPRLAGLARALDGRELPLATSARLFDEALDVLMRPVIQRSRPAEAAEVRRWLDGHFNHACWRIDPSPSPLLPRAPDPGDQFLWDLLGAHGDLVLWTRDKRLIGDRAMRGRVIEPPVFNSFDNQAIKSARLTMPAHPWPY